MSAPVATPDAYKLIHDGALALARMEAAGIRVDTDYLDKALADTTDKIAELEADLMASKFYRHQWVKAFGAKAKLGSDKQLVHLLFQVLKFPYPAEEFTETGLYKSDDSILAQVDHPFVNEWRRLKRLRKLKSPFLDGVKREVVDGFLHPFFNLHTTTTYRSSSGDDKSDEGSSRSFNMQNLPVRDPERAAVIRRCFIPRKGRRLVENDFAALEFAVASLVWNCPDMIAYAADPDKDVHKDSAADIFCCDRSLVSKLMRYVAKNQFVFPTLYGSYWKNCAKNIWESIGKLNLSLTDGTPVREHLKTHGITKLGEVGNREWGRYGEQKPKRGTFQHHMQGVEDSFMRRFPKFAKAKDPWYDCYRERGWFRMVTGFVCSGLYSKNFLLNAPVQGPGFHVCLKTLIKFDRLLLKKQMGALLVGEVHDCIIGDVPDDELQRYLNTIEWVVAEYLPKVWAWVQFPLRIEAEVTPVCEDGGHWGAKAQWTKQNGVWALAPKD